MPGAAFALSRLGARPKAAVLAALAWLRFNVAGLAALAEAWRLLTRRRPARPLGQEGGA